MASWCVRPHPERSEVYVDYPLTFPVVGWSWRLAAEAAGAEGWVVARPIGSNADGHVR